MAHNQVELWICFYSGMRTPGFTHLRSPVSVLCGIRPLGQVAHTRERRDDDDGMMRPSHGALFLTVWCWLSLHSYTTAFSTAANEDGRRRESPPPPSARQLSVETTERTAPSDTASLFAETRTNKRRRRHEQQQQEERPPAAPLVDSALLRFLSAEKKKQQQLDLQQQYGTNGRIRREQEPRRVAESSAESEEVFGDTVGSSALASERTRSSSLSSSSQQQRFAEGWLGQYNANRVTQTLLTVGAVDLELAQKAGEAVQNHALARTARRRVREFLRQRDLQWIQQQQHQQNQTIANPDSEMTYSESRITFRPHEYGLQDVVTLLTDMGLTGTDICTILTHTPSVALMQPRDETNEGSSRGETLQVTATRAFRELLCGSLKLRRYDARKVVRKCPGLLTMRGSKTAEQVVSLLSSLGVSKGALARDKTGLPVLLSRSPASLFRLVAFLSSDAVRMPVHTIGPLLRRGECLQLLNSVAPVPRLQLEHDAMTQQGLQDDNVPTSVSTLWGRSGAQERREQVNQVYRLMSMTAWTLRHKIGTEDLGKVVAAFPGVLLLDAETQILPVADFLMNELGIWQDDLPRVLQLYPALLGMDRAKMHTVVTYLRSLDVDEESLGSIFRAFPSLLTLNVETDMKPVVEFLRSIGITNIGRFITRLPPVLGYSVENELVPKWEYLSKVCMDPTFQLSIFPAYFSYPLDRKVKARYEYLQHVKRIPSQLIALDTILRYGDRDFATKVAREQDGGEAFAEYVQSQQATARRNDGRRRVASGKRNLREKRAPSASRLQRGGDDKQP